MIQNVTSTALDEERHVRYVSKESPGMFHIRKADSTVSIYFFLFFSNFQIFILYGGGAGEDS